MDAIMSPYRATPAGVSHLRRLALSSPTLSTEAERKLAYEVQEGSPQALDHLLRAHLRLVFSVVRKYRSFGVPLDEITAQGLLGLVEAARRFDPSRGVRFSTYAVWWIRGYVRLHTLTNRRIVRLPAARHDRKLIAGLRITQHRLTRERGEPPSMEAVAEALDVPVRDVEQMHAALSGRDTQYVGDGDDLANDSQSGSPDCSPEGIIADQQEVNFRMRSIQSALDALNPRERRVIVLRYLSLDTNTLGHVGRDLGVSRERARQIEQRALERIRVAVGA
jgi:RNA polymerase sigma-32 factor